MSVIQLELPDYILLEAVQAAVAAEIELNELLVTRIVAGADLDEGPLSKALDVDVVARQVYQKAVMFDENDEFTVEELHRFAFGLSAWKTRTAGQRIALGRAFKKLVEMKEPIVGDIPLFKYGFVEFLRKDGQNRAIYTRKLSSLE